MDCSLPGSSVHGFSRQEYWSGLPFPSPGEGFPTQGSSPSLLHWQVDFLPLSHLGSPIFPFRQQKIPWEIHDDRNLSSWRFSSWMVLSFIKVSANSKDLEKWFSMKHISKSLWWTPLWSHCGLESTCLDRKQVQSLVQEDSTCHGS